MYVYTYVCMCVCGSVISNIIECMCTCFASRTSNQPVRFAKRKLRLAFLRRRDLLATRAVCSALSRPVTFLSPLQRVATHIERRASAQRVRRLVVAICNNGCMDALSVHALPGTHSMRSGQVRLIRLGPGITVELHADAAIIKPR